MAIALADAALAEEHCAVDVKPRYGQVELHHRAEVYAHHTVGIDAILRVHACGVDPRLEAEAYGLHTAIVGRGASFRLSGAARLRLAHHGCQQQ